MLLASMVVTTISVQSGGSGRWPCLSGTASSLVVHPLARRRDVAGPHIAAGRSCPQRARCRRLTSVDLSGRRRLRPWPGNATGGYVVVSVPGTTHPAADAPLTENEPTAIAVARTAAARAECGRSRETLSSHNRMLHDNYNFCSRFLTYGYLITRCPHARDESWQDCEMRHEAVSRRPVLSLPSAPPT
jgi:hypothetical protein